MFLFDDNIRPYLIIMLGIMTYIGSIALIPRFIQDHKEHLTYYLDVIKKGLL